MTNLLEKLDKHANLFIGCLIALTLTGGIVYSLYLGDRFLFHDEEQYYVLAENLAENGVYSLDGQTPTAWRPPGLPLLLAPLIKSGAGVPVLRIFNFGLFSLNIALIALFLRKQSGLAAVFGTAMVLAYPVLFYTAGTLYPQTALGTTLLLLLHLLNRKPCRSLLIGAICGFQVLLSPIYLFVTGMVCVWLAFDRLKYATAAFLTALIVIAPWSIRNYFVFDAIFFISTNGGINLYLGNNPHEMTDVVETMERNQERIPDSVSLMGEIKRDRFFRRKALDYMVSHPLESLKNYGEKFLNHFNYWNELATDSQESSWKKWVLFLSYNSLLALVLLRLAMLKWHPLRRYEIMILGAYLAFALVQALFFTRIRFRLPFDYLLIVLNGSFAARLVQGED